MHIMHCTAVFVLCLRLDLAAAEVAATPPVEAAAPETFNVWPGTAPGETGDIPPEKLESGGEAKPIHRYSNVSQPTLTVFRPPADKDIGVAVIVNPGGLASHLAWDLEGEEVARWLTTLGITGIAHKYRVPSRAGKPRHLAALQDAQRAMSLVRSKAGELGIDADRTGMLGFSAGGNLTAIACTNYDQRAYDPIDDVDKISCRPHFAILIYPAWLEKDGTTELIPEVKVTAETPQMFLVHAGDDPVKADASLAMYQALRRANVPAELHIYVKGGHGYGLRESENPVSHWPARCEEWMRSQKLLEPAKK